MLFSVFWILCIYCVIAYVNGQEDDAVVDNQAGDRLACVAGNSKYIEWVEDYKVETDEMEEICHSDIRKLHTDLIGKHGPPIEIEIKTAACYDACQQYIRNIDYLLEVSGCTCEELDKAFPLSSISHPFESWCQRRPTEFLWRELGVASEWGKFNARYCQCSTGIACSFASRVKMNWSISMIIIIVTTSNFF